MRVGIATKVVSDSSRIIVVKRAVEWRNILYDGIDGATTARRVRRHHGRET